MKEVLKVFLWGQEIGRLSWHDARKTTFFVYNPEFLKSSLDVAPPAASIYHPLSTRAIFGETERIYQKLPSFIADSLPDAWGNQLFEQWRKENKLTERSVTSLEKLAFIGKRGMGALEFIPEIERGTMNDKIDIKALADLAEKIAIERENVSILPDESLTLQSLIAVGTSAGGRQPKGIIAMNRETGEIRSGQVDLESGFDYYILKFGDKIRSSAELEQTYYEMALAAGIRAPKSIIRKVAAAVSTFRSLAKKNGVSDEWTGRVEATIIDHLKAWGEWNEDNDMKAWTINGHSVSDIRIEQALHN